MGKSPTEATLNKARQALLDLPASVPRRLDLPGAEVSYHPNVFTPEESERLLSALLATIPWRQNRIRFYGKESLVPRLESWHGDPGKSYAYSGIRLDPEPWTPELLAIKERAERLAGVAFNSVLLNHYRDGADRVAWHSDDEPELGPRPVIASVSFGAERRFRLRHKEYKSNGEPVRELPLASGSVLLMAGDTQANWKHEVPRASRPAGPRVNLTFRVIQ